MVWSPAEHLLQSVDHLLAGVLTVGAAI